MSSWNFDLQSLPRDRNILAETAKGEVLVTRYNQPTKGSPRGWFSMIGDESRIVAWQEMPAPSGRSNSPPSAERVNPHRSGGAVANAGGCNVDRSAQRAPVEAGIEPTSLAGGLESGIEHSVVDRNTSGPDVKRAPLSNRSDGGLDIVHRHSEINLPIIEDVGGGL